MHYYLLITLVYMGVLFVLSAVPGETESDDSVFVWVVAWTPSLIQKVLHVVLYAVLAWLWFRTLTFLTSRLLTQIALAFVLTVGFGAFNEWYQTRVPGRFGSLTDVLLNAAGALVGVLIAAL